MNFHSIYLGNSNWNILKSKTRVGTRWRGISSFHSASPDFRLVLLSFLRFTDFPYTPYLVQPSHCSFHRADLSPIISVLRLISWQSGSTLRFYKKCDLGFSRCFPNEFESLIAYYIMLVAFIVYNLIPFYEQTFVYLSRGN